MPSPAALHSLIFDSGLFDGDELVLNSHDQQQHMEQHQQQQQLQHQQLMQQQRLQAQQPPRASSAESSFIDDDDGMGKNNKLQERMTKKKNREKQRRQDVNSAFAELTMLLDQVSPLPSKSTKATNRIDLIQRTIKVIEELRDERESNKRRRLDPREMSASPMMPPPLPLQSNSPIPPTSSMPPAHETGAPQHPLMMVLPVLSPTTQAPTSCMVYPIPAQANGAYAIPSASEIGGIFNIPVSSVQAPAPVAPGPSPAVVLGKDNDLNKPGMRDPVLNGEKPKPQANKNSAEVNDFAQCA